MSRATDLCELYQNAVKMLTQNPQEWIGLLASAAKFYKLSFDKNVLVYMQRPEAGLIATMRDWNIRTGRYVNKHSKAIAVLDMSDPKARLTYYFDFADTHGDLESLQKTMELIWKVENQYKSDLLMRFQEKYGTAGKSIEEALVQMVMQQTEKILNLYMEGFAVREPESILYGAPLEAVKDEFATYVQNSAVYIVLKKCGLSTDIISEDAFNHISHYGSLELFMQLGACSTAAARTVLRQIYQEIENIKEERSRLYEQRSLNASGIHREGRWNAVSEPEHFKGETVRPDTDRKIRENLEGVHDGMPSGTDDRVNPEGRNQPDDNESRRGSGGAERTADTEIIGESADAGEWNHDEPGGTHESFNDDSGRSDYSGSSLPDEINRIEDRETARSDGEEGSSGRAFFVPRRYNDGENRQYYREILTDTILYPVADLAERSVRDRRDFEKDSDSQISLFKFGLVDENTDDVGGILGELPEETRIVIPDKTAIEIPVIKEPPASKGKDEKSSREESVTEKQVTEEQTTEESNKDKSTIEKTDEEESTKEESTKEESTKEESVTEEPPAVRYNYVYSENHHLYDGGPKEKCRNNIEAIRLLKTLKQEGRHATPEEQLTLAKYVGWGGLANALTPEKRGWEKEYDTLQNLLDEDEMRSAAESSLTAYYTEQQIIKHIYAALERFGFQKGNILDPAMGTGNFYSVLPDSMKKSALYGVEIDRLSGSIAKELYPNAYIEIKGYEDIEFSNNFFDVAVGNIPFNSIKISDRRYDRYGFRIHDYFIGATRS